MGQHKDTGLLLDFNSKNKNYSSSFTNLKPETREFSSSSKMERL